MAIATKLDFELDGEDNLEYSNTCKCDDREDKKILRDLLRPRYLKLGNRHLGCGGHKKYVFKALDFKEMREVAIKVLPKSHNDTSIDIQIPELSKLKAISEFPGRGKMLFSLMEDYIESPNWIGIVFPFYGPNLHNIQHQKGSLPFMWDDVIAIAYQLLQALKFLHSNGIAHMDIKPGNIVTVCGQSSELTIQNAFCKDGKFYPQDFRKLKDARIRIIDLGSSAFIGKYGRITDLHSNTLRYRSPELILGLPCTEDSDKWSAGCTIMEFYYGFTPFPINSDIDHLDAILKVIGPISLNMLDPAALLDNAFSFEQVIKRRRDLTGYNKYKPLKDQFIFGPDETRKRRFMNLIQSLLVVNPQERSALEDALELSIFQEVPDYLKISKEENQILDEKKTVYA